MVVDDEETICETLKDVLEEEGYHVAVACDGVDALTQLRRLTIEGRPRARGHPRGHLDLRPFARAERRPHHEEAGRPGHAPRHGPQILRVKAATFRGGNRGGLPGDMRDRETRKDGRLGLARPLKRKEPQLHA